MRTIIIASLAAGLLVLAGCSTAKSAFTNPTGNITIPRQEFLNSFALIKVLWKDIRHNAELACVRGPEEQVASCLTQLRAIDAKAKAINYSIEAKIAVPESEIDWAVVMELLKAIVSLVP